MIGLPSKFSYSRWLPRHGLGDEGLLAFFRRFRLPLVSLSSMTLRALLTMAVVLISGSALAAPAARPAPRTVPAAPMAFYVVKGAPDACGPGCDRWIAVEGHIDSGAAPRFRKFLRQLRDRNLPIYFTSPGGNLVQTMAMGAMLREKPVVARVARSVVAECGYEAQDGEACLKLKQSGRELHGELWSRGAPCYSACPYLMLGATTREIAPDAVLAVHSPAVGAHFSGAGTPAMRAAATERALEGIDRMLQNYIVKMGADVGLLGLARTVKFEDMHVLTREEIARFGIDRRELVETPWTFENGIRSIVHKTVARRDEGDGAYRMAQWWLFCFTTEQFELDFRRPAATSSVFPTFSISNSGLASLDFKLAPLKTSGFEIWGLRMTRDSLQALAREPQFDFTETSQAPDGRRRPYTTVFSSKGLGGALERLFATCPPAKTTAPMRTVGSGDSAAKN